MGFEREKSFSEIPEELPHAVSVSEEASSLGATPEPGIEVARPEPEVQEVLLTPEEIKAAEEVREEISACLENKLELAQMAEASKKEIIANSPSYAVIKNPMDLAGDADNKRFEVALRNTLLDSNVDAVLLIMLFQVLPTFPL